MSRRRDGAQTARWERLKALTHDLAQAQVVDTPEARARADRIKHDIAAVYRAAGYHYPSVMRAHLETDTRPDTLRMRLEKLWLETGALREAAAAAVDRARHGRQEWRAAVGRSRAIRLDKKH